MKNLFLKLPKGNSRITAIEYGLIAAGLSFAIVAIVQGIAANVSGLLAALKSGMPLL
jgi:pilus assembly protein Flp/PilA